MPRIRVNRACIAEQRADYRVGLIRVCGHFTGHVERAPKILRQEKSGSSSRRVSFRVSLRWQSLKTDANRRKPTRESENANNPVIRAAELILDRTGFRRGVRSENAKPENETFDVTRLTDGERQRLGAAIAVVRSIKADIRARLAAEDAAGDTADTSRDQR
jgi:hypothetical protein